MSTNAIPAQNPIPPGFAEPDPKNYATEKRVAGLAREVVQDAMASARTARGNIVHAWRRNIDAFFSIRSRQNFHGRANVVDPEIFRSVETIYARLERGLFSSEPWVRGDPGHGEPRADAKQASINTNLLHYQFSQGPTKARTIKSAAKEMVICGTTVGKVSWDEEIRRRRMRHPYTGRLLAPEDVHFYRGPRIAPVDLESFYVADPIRGETAEDQDFVIEKKVVWLQWLRQLQRQGKVANIDLINPEEQTPTVMDEESLRQARAAAIGSQYEGPVSAKLRHFKKSELWMYEGPFDLYGDGEDIECWIWLVNGMIPILVSENPYWHGRRSYVSAPCVRIPGHFYGLSPAQPVIDLWSEMCDLHNMSLDSAVLSLNPAFKVGAGAGINMKKWLLSPGSFLPCNDPSQIQELVVPPMVDVAHAVMGPLRNMMRETTSATDLLQGQSGNTDKATIYQGMLTEANVRIAVMGSNFTEDYIEPSWMMGWGLNQQFMDQDTNVRIMGRDGFEWIPVRPQDIRYPMDWKAVGIQNIGSILTRALNLERFMAVMTPVALQGGVQLDFEEIAKTYWESIGLTDSDRIIGKGGVGPMDPRHENLLIAQRQPVDPHAAEDFGRHYREHIKFRQQIVGEAQSSGRAPDPIVLQMIDEHLLATQDLFKKVQQAQATQRALMAQMLENQIAAPAQGNGNNGGMPSVPALGNQQAFGPAIGAAKESGERLGGRLG